MCTRSSSSKKKNKKKYKKKDITSKWLVIVYFLILAKWETKIYYYYYYYNRYFFLHFFFLLDLNLNMLKTLNFEKLCIKFLTRGENYNWEKFDIFHLVNCNDFSFMYDCENKLETLERVSAVLKNE